MDGDGIIELNQSKTSEDDNPNTVFIVVRGVYAAIIGATPLQGPWILGTYWGKHQRSPKGAHQWFSKACTAAGLPHLTSHSFRKGRLTHKAEDRASAHQLQALGGHKTLSELHRYTQRADRKRLAVEMVEEEESV